MLGLIAQAAEATLGKAEKSIVVVDIEYLFRHRRVAFREFASREKKQPQLPDGMGEAVIIQRFGDIDVRAEIIATLNFRSSSVVVRMITGGRLVWVLAFTFSRMSMPDISED